MRMGCEHCTGCGNIPSIDGCLVVCRACRGSGWIERRFSDAFERPMSRAARDRIALHRDDQRAAAARGHAEWPDCMFAVGREIEPKNDK